MPASTITRHLPLITPRIEFFPSKHFGAPPIITLRTDFGATRPPHNSSHTGDIKTDMEAEFISTDNNDADIDTDFVDAELTETLIAKPIGQAGRPHSGGYNLSKKLVGWRPQLLSAVTESVHEKADKILDTKKSYRQQNHEDLNAICDLVQSKYPILKKYKGCWPVHDMLKLHLKYTSTRSNYATKSARKLRSK